MLWIVVSTENSRLLSRQNCLYIKISILACSSSHPHPVLPPPPRSSTSPATLTVGYYLPGLLGWPFYGQIDVTKCLIVSFGHHIYLWLKIPQRFKSHKESIWFRRQLPQSVMIRPQHLRMISWIWHLGSSRLGSLLSSGSGVDNTVIETTIATIGDIIKAIDHLTTWHWWLRTPCISEEVTYTMPNSIYYLTVVNTVIYCNISYRG